MRKASKKTAKTKAKKSKVGLTKTCSKCGKKGFNKRSCNKKGHKK